MAFVLVQWAVVRPPGAAMTEVSRSPVALPGDARLVALDILPSEGAHPWAVATVAQEDARALWIMDWLDAPAGVATSEIFSRSVHDRVPTRSTPLLLSTSPRGGRVVAREPSGTLTATTWSLDAPTQQHALPHDLAWLTADAQPITAEMLATQARSGQPPLQHQVGWVSGHTAVMLPEVPKGRTASELVLFHTDGRPLDTLDGFEGLTTNYSAQDLHRVFAPPRSENQIFYTAHNGHFLTWLSCDETACESSYKSVTTDEAVRAVDAAPAEQRLAVCGGQEARLYATADPTSQYPPRWLASIPLRAPCQHIQVIDDQTLLVVDEQGASVVALAPRGGWLW